MRHDLSATLQALASSEDRFRQIEANLNKASDDDLGLMRQSFVGQLGVEWDELLSGAGSFSTGTELQQRAQRFDKFLTRLQNIVLQPRRSLTAQRLDEWLASWKPGRIPWLEYLRDADDDSLDEIDDILGEVDTAELADSVVQEIAHDWLAYWLGRLKTQERSAKILAEWILHVNYGLYHAQQYAHEFIADQVVVAIQETEQPLLRMMRERWLNERRAALRQRDVKVDALGLDELKARDEADWGDFQSALHALEPALQDRSQSELALIERAIAGWDAMAPESVRALVRSLSDVARITLRLKDFAKTHAVDEFYEPASEDVAELVGSRPAEPDAAVIPSLTQLIDAFAKLEVDVNVWEQRFGEVAERVQRDAQRWDRAPLPEELRVQIELGNDLLDDIATLKDLAEADGKVAERNRRVRESVEQSLSTQERQLWEALNERRARGEARADMLALSALMEPSELLAALLGLNEKRFIHLEVVL